MKSTLTYCTYLGPSFSNLKGGTTGALQHLRRITIWPLESNALSRVIQRGDSPRCLKAETAFRVRRTHEAVGSVQ